MKAASNGNTDMVKILLEHGADVNSRSDEYGQLHIIIFTPVHNIYPFILYLHTFICMYKYNPSKKIYIINLMYLYLGYTSLMQAINYYYGIGDETATVRILLEHGADVNTKDGDGELHTIIVTIVFYPSFYIPIINQILL